MSYREQAAASARRRQVGRCASACVGAGQMGTGLAAQLLRMPGISPLRRPRRTRRSVPRTPSARPGSRPDPADDVDEAAQAIERGGSVALTATRRPRRSTARHRGGGHRGPRRRRPDRASSAWLHRDQRRHSHRRVRRHRRRLHGAARPRSPRRCLLRLPRRRAGGDQDPRRLRTRPELRGGLRGQGQEQPTRPVTPRPSR